MESGTERWGQQTLSYLLRWNWHLTLGQLVRLNWNVLQSFNVTGKWMSAGGRIWNIIVCKKLQFSSENVLIFPFLNYISQLRQESSIKCQGPLMPKGVKNAPIRIFPNCCWGNPWPWFINKVITTGASSAVGLIHTHTRKKNLAHCLTDKQWHLPNIHSYHFFVDVDINKLWQIILDQ